MLQRGPEPLLQEKGMNCVVYNKLHMLKKRETLLWTLLEGEVAIVNIKAEKQICLVYQRFFISGSLLVI